MLVLTRKQNESVMINGNTVVEIISINGNQVKIGFSAPRSVNIIRTELTDAGRKQKYLKEVNINGNVLESR